MSGKALKAELILENGVCFSGKAFGFVEDRVGEIIFNTNMIGYEEILTDAAYAGEFVVMTYPLMGNYGISLDNMEANGEKLNAFIVREKCDFPSNWRCEMNLDGFLKQNKIIGLEGIDTRALTQIIRDNGSMRAFITTKADDMTSNEIESKIREFKNTDMIRKSTIKEKYVVDGPGPNVAFIHLGAKNGIINEFKKLGYKVSVFPAYTKAEEILESAPDFVFFSDGPGNPMDAPEIISTIKELIGQKPIFGVSLGHQLLALALDCKTEKMKFGHHGGNYPVRDLESKRVYITAQNHGYVVNELSDDVEATFININDNTIEGIKHKTLPLFGVQFYPDACPGFFDLEKLLRQFIMTSEGGFLNAKR